jgi:hypothetical protein
MRDGIGVLGSGTGAGSSLNQKSEECSRLWHWSWQQLESEIRRMLGFGTGAGSS